MNRFILYCVLLMPLFTFSQESEKLQFKIGYQFIHILDKKTQDTLLNTDMSLRVGAQTSYFSTSSLSQVFVNKEDLPPPPPTTSATIVVQGRPGANVEEWGPSVGTIRMNLINQQIQQLYHISINNYTLKIDYPTIAWNILPEQKNIGSFECQKATGTFGGRNYTAWFTKALPIGAGPWKLNGLPGVILEAYDDRAEIFFLFDGFKPAGEKEIVEPILYKEPIVISPKDFQRLYDGYLDNPSAFVQSVTNYSGSVPVMFTDRQKNWYTKDEALLKLQEMKKNRKHLNSNPIELP